MPQPASLFGAKMAPQLSGPAYLCVNYRCRFRAYEQLDECPECGRIGKFMLESTVNTRNLIAGTLFGVVGGVLILLSLLLLVASVSGSFGPQSEERPIWKPVLLISGLGAIFLFGGISTAKGSYWLIRLLKMYRR